MSRPVDGGNERQAAVRYEGNESFLNRPHLRDQFRGRERARHVHPDHRGSDATAGRGSVLRSGHIKLRKVDGWEEMERMEKAA